MVKVTLGNDELQALPLGVLAPLVANFNKRKARKALDPIRASDLVLSATVNIEMAAEYRGGTRGLPSYHGAISTDVEAELVEKTLARIEETPIEGLVEVFNVELTHEPFGGLVPSRVWAELPDSVKAKIIQENITECTRLVTGQLQTARVALEHWRHGEQSRKQRQEKEEAEKKARLASDISDIRLLGRKPAKMLGEIVTKITTDPSIPPETRDVLLGMFREFNGEVKEWEETRREVMKGMMGGSVVLPMGPMGPFGLYMPHGYR
jgi:hypothetical protein